MDRLEKKTTPKMTIFGVFDPKGARVYCFLQERFTETSSSLMLVRLEKLHRHITMFIEHIYISTKNLLGYFGAPTQLAMRSLCPDHFVVHKSFLHTWGNSQTVAKCGPCRWNLM